MVTCNITVLDDGSISYTSNASKDTTIEQIGMACQALYLVANGLTSQCRREAINSGQNIDDYDFKFLGGMTHCLQTSLKTEAINLEQQNKRNKELIKYICGGDKVSGYSATEESK